MARISPARRARLKARRHQRAAMAAEVVRLREAAGHSCADCRHCDRSIRHRGPTCDLGEDGGGVYQSTTLDNLCWQWEPKP